MVMAAGWLLVSGPNSPAEATEVTESAPAMILAEPIVELDPEADPNDPEVQQEAERIKEEITSEQLDAATETAPEEPTLRAEAGAAGFSRVFNTSGDGTIPTAAQRARIDAAISTWAAALSTSGGPIVVEVTWRDFGSTSVLGSAGPSAFYNTDEGFIPTALWNTRNNTDVNGATPEIYVSLNSARPWYTGTGSPTGNQLDLESVMLHELGHGLGFLGSESPGNAAPPASVYDHHVSYLGRPYLTGSNPSAALVSDNLYIATSDTYQYKVFAPSAWTSGSSLSHFDEASYPRGSAGALMTPTTAAGEANRTLDGPVLGVMSQIGWELRAPLSVPTAVSVATSSNPAVVTWSNNFDTFSYVPDKYRVDVLNGSTVIASTEVPASSRQASFSGLPGGTWTFRVTPVDQRGGTSVDGTPASTRGTILFTPSQVNYVSITGVGLTQTIDWPDAARNPSNYLVEMSTDGQTWRTIGTPTRSTLNYRFREGTYQVRVRGRNSTGSALPTTSTFVPVGTTFVRPAPLDHEIRRLYLATFLREPDQVGVEFWREERARAVPLDTIANGFTQSGEFINTYGNLNNTQFVEQLYLNVFNRPVDPVGRGWVGLLNSGWSRGQVLINLSNSAEFIADTSTSAETSNQGSVRRLYLGYLKRLPDPDGFADWVGELDAGRESLASTSDGFAESTEFLNTYGSLNNTDFVTLLYYNILSRDPDNLGLQYWTNQLNSGASSRGEVMLGFSESPELVLLTGTAR